MKCQDSYLPCLCRTREGKTKPFPDPNQVFFFILNQTLNTAGLMKHPLWTGHILEKAVRVGAA